MKRAAVRPHRRGGIPKTCVQSGRLAKEIVEYLQPVMAPEHALAIEKHGGKVTHQPFVSETVGTLIMFEDTEGNVVGAMQYGDPQ